MPPLPSRKIIPFEELVSLKDRAGGENIIHCHGVFDVLHAGHLAYFESAKQFGGVLVVTLTADQFVNKGPGRPYFTAQVRARMLAALESVDFVSISQHATAVPAIEILKPNFYVKGPDYKNLANDVSGNIYREQAAAEKFGGKLVFTDDETHSSSYLINRFFSQWTEDQSRAIEQVKSCGGLALIDELFEKMAQERVRIIGEPIVDTYSFCVPESISSKNPCISAKFLYEENYAGGSLAIANHLSDFAKSVDLVMTHGGEPYFIRLLSEKMDPRVQIQAVELNNIPTPRKTRYIATDLPQRMFELTNIRFDQWKQHDPKSFCELIKKQDFNKDTTILADFGHGLFENSVLETMGTLPGFLSVNVQTNSSNFGFNPFTKHSKFSYLCIDTKEARVAYHDRFSSPLDLVNRISMDLRPKGAAIGMTVGPNGAYYFPKVDPQAYAAPAFADKVVDATGAGDAYFALTSLLVKIGCPPVMVPFIGNVFAGLKTEIIGNKSPVTRAKLYKSISSILR